MTATRRCRTTVEESLRGVRLDVGESVRCESGESMCEGHPVTIVARLRETGRWDVEEVYGVQHALTDLQAFERRDGEGLALAEGELAVVLHDQQAWMTLVRPDVLAWIESYHQ